MTDDTRIGIKAALPILGLPERTVRAMAACGELPGAAFYRGRWTFNLARLRKFVELMEETACQSERPRRAVSGAATHSGAASRLRAGTSSGLYAQTIQKLRNGVGKQSATAR